jgi:RNA-directed DNA polymerase
VSDWEEITSFGNLCRAAKRAARCKRRVAGAARFLERLEPEALALQRELLDGRWRPSRPVQFTIRDPKERVITAAPFRDRVVHHALIDPLEARLDAALVPHSFACRRGLGTHKALAHARELVRRHTHFLKLDIAKCFESIGHELVLGTIKPLVGDAPTLELCRLVLGGAEQVLGRGLPIGNLTSQWFANLVLGRIDRFVLEGLGTPGYVRYMDDFSLLADDKQRLRTDMERIEAFVRDELGLALKERATILAPVSQGLPFLGWRIYRGVTRLRPENARRTRRRLRHRRWELRTGRIAADRYAAAVQSVLAHLHHGNTLGWRRGVLNATFAAELDWEAGPLAPRTA